jgi:hypothetical protein
MGDNVKERQESVLNYVMTAFLMYKRVKIASSSLISSLMSNLRNLLQCLADELHNAAVAVEQ